MKAKEWVKLLKPLTVEVLKFMEEESEQATQAYEAYSAAGDALYKECKEIIDLRMKGFKEAGASNGAWLNGRHINDRMTNAIREATVKYRAVTHALKIELNLDVVPFPLMDSAMFMPLLTTVQNTILDGKHDFVTLKKYLDDVTKMANDLLLTDDTLVKFFLSNCKDAVEKKGEVEYLRTISSLVDMTNRVQVISEKTGKSPVALMLGDPHIRNLLLKARGLQNSLSLC